MVALRFTGFAENANAYNRRVWEAAPYNGFMHIANLRTIIRPRAHDMRPYKRYIVIPM